MPHLNAQAAATWDPVPAADLALKDNPARPGSAAMLLDLQVYQDDVQAFRTYYYRIKIFNAEGKAYADVEIPYDSKNYTIEDIRARTTRPNGAVLEFEGQIFDKIVAKSKRTKVQEKAFVLPAVEVGCVIEYSYKITWHKYQPELFLHPERYLLVGAYTYPSASWTLQQPLYVRRAGFTLRPVPKENLSWASIRLPKEVEVRKLPDGTVLVEATNIAPLEKEEFMPPEDALTSQVHFYYTVGYLSGEQSFWVDQGNRFEEHLKQFIGNDKAISRAVSQIVSTSDSPETKIRKLYARVQRIRNTSYERLKTEKELERENQRNPKNAADVLNRGYGFGNELNYLFVALLRAAGLNAVIVQLTDRHRGVFNTTVLETSQFDAMVVMVALNGHSLFFDPATRFCPYGLIPWAETGGSGVATATWGAVIQIPGQDSGWAVKQRNVDLKLDRDGKAVGKIDISFSGQEALTRRLELDQEDDAGKRKAMEDEIESWLPEGSKLEIKHTSNWDDSEGDLHVECEVTIPDLAIPAGQRLLFSPAVLQSNRAHRLYHGKRSYPVVFRHSYRELDSVTIELPEGYQVEGLPFGRKESNDIYRLETSYSVQQQKLNFHRVFALDGFYFPVESYSQIKALFNRVEVSDGERLVLRADASTTH